ncbi:hypothetical protein [Streptomyces sp. NPDC048639]|uniref:hypothetical protein n=1 Tax=Streptomyces sp. NPDC048639 TaxID=3365581 RepID=UPI003723B6C2
MPGIEECLLKAMALPGARGAAVADCTSGLALGTIGDSPNGDHEASVAETAELARVATDQPTFAPASDGGQAGGRSTPVEDVIVTTRSGYHLLRFVETTFDSSVFIHVWLDREEGNLALARIGLAGLAERLVLG